MPEDLSPVEQPPLTQDELANRVVEFVRVRDWVTFIELEHEFASVTDVIGHTAITAREFPNIILWPRLSHSWATLLSQLIDEKRLFYHPSSLLIYMIDGGVPRMPLAKRLRHYSKPHWFAVSLRTVPMGTKKKGRT